MIPRFTHKEDHHCCSSEGQANSPNIGQKKHLALRVFLEGCNSLVTLLYILRTIDCHSINSIHFEYLRQDENEFKWMQALVGQFLLTEMIKGVIMANS